MKQIDLKPEEVHRTEDWRQHVKGIVIGVVPLVGIILHPDPVIPAGYAVFFAVYGWAIGYFSFLPLSRLQRAIAARLGLGSQKD
jgi:hypothetical protein